MQLSLFDLLMCTAVFLGVDLQLVLFYKTGTDLLRQLSIWLYRCFSSSVIAPSYHSKFIMLKFIFDESVPPV